MIYFELLIHSDLTFLTEVGKSLFFQIEDLQRLKIV